MSIPGVITTDSKSNVGTTFVWIESEFLWNYDGVPLCTVCLLYLNYSFHFLNDFWRKYENLGKIRAYFEECLAISYQPSVLLSGIHTYFLAKVLRSGDVCGFGAWILPLGLDSDMIEASSSRQIGLCLDCERFPVTNGQLCSKFSAMQIEDFSICFIFKWLKN